MGGSRVSTLLNALFSIFLAVTLAIVHNWKLGLIGSTFVPIVWIASVCQAKIWASHGVLETMAFHRAMQASTIKLKALYGERICHGFAKHCMRFPFS